MDEVPKFLQAKYDNVEFIDHGAHGRVYKCTRAETVTAVKILDALDSESQKRFRSEVDILQRIDHKNVLKVLDAGDTDGYYWYESDFASEGHFGQMAGYLFCSDLDRVKYFSQICSGVQALHDLNPPIIHRDLKPSNILAFLDPEQRTVLKIADFGLAALAGNASGLTASGAVLGTAHYIAPERMRNPRIKSPQSDIYSLGITFLEACTGRWLPSKENLELVPATFRHIIEKMVREYQDDRYQTVAEVLEAFNSLPFDRLFYGRELGDNERGVATYHINIGRELENAINQLLKSSADNVLDRLAALERTLDRLVDAHDHEAAILVCIDRNIAALIEKAKPGALFRIVERFSNATRLTKDQDWHHPDLYSWSHFFAETFGTSFYFNTKSLCLEGLAYLLDRFGGPEVKHCLYRTIKNIEDPNDMEELAKCLRQVGREDIASLLDGAPDQRDLDLDAITVTLRGAN